MSVEADPPFVSQALKRKGPGAVWLHLALCFSSIAPHHKGGASNALTFEALRRGKDFKVSRSKARRTSLNVLRGRGVKGNVLVTLYERERRSVVTALQIERLERVVVGAIDIDHLAWL